VRPSHVARIVAAVVRVVVAVMLAGAAPLVAALSGAAPAALAEGPADWQVWLDAPVRHDAQPGSTVRVGFIMWDPLGQSTVNVYGTEVRLHPATGRSGPSSAQPTQDWPGHSEVELVVPKGGFGRLQFGILWPDQISGVGRSITLGFHPVAVAGVGPPPDMSLRRIGSVRVEPALPAIVHQPFDVDLAFEPRLGWPAGSIALPDHLTLRVRIPRSEDAQEVTATLVDRTAARYRASVEIDQPGPYVLEAATRAGAPPDERFTETEVRVQVEPPDQQAAPAAPRPPSAPAAATEPGPPLAVLGLAAVLVVGGFVALVRFLRAEW
jgi:hypothetical protein